MRRALSGALLIVLGTLAGLALAELVLRVVGYEGDHERTEVVFDPRYGTVRKDSWIFDFDVPPGARSTEINGQTVPLPKPAGETRVLFVGDSGTEGAYVERSQSFPMQLQALLDAHDPASGIRIINAGVYGMTTLDELHFLRERLLVLEPDVVVVGLFMANDINFNLGHHQHRGARARSALVHFVYSRLLVLNAKYRWFRSDVVAGEPADHGDLGLVDEHGFHMLGYRQGEVATYVKDSSALVDRAFDVLVETFRRFQRLGEQHGFAFRVVILPSPSPIAGELRILALPDVWASIARWGVDVTPAQLDLDQPTRRVHAICRELGIVCLDPTERLRRVGMEVFFPRDEHLTPVGHAQVAELLFAERQRLLGSP